MSTFGGTAGVWTVFVIVVLAPEASVVLTDDGSTPAASATPTTVSASAPRPAVRPTQRRLKLLIRDPSRFSMNPIGHER